MKRIILFLSLIFCTATAIAQQVKGTGIRYVYDTPTVAPPDTAYATEVAYSINQQRFYVWNRNTSAWQLEINVSQGSGAPVAAPGTGPKLYFDKTSGFIYRWDGAAWVAMGTATGDVSTAQLGDSTAVFRDSLEVLRDSIDVLRAALDAIEIDSTRLLQDSILVYYRDGLEVGRDTLNVSGSGGSISLIDSTRLFQDSILVYYQDGIEIGRDTIPVSLGNGGSDGVVETGDYGDILQQLILGRTIGADVIIDLSPLVNEAELTTNTGAVATQIEAEEGSVTTVRRFTPERIAQAIGALETSLAHILPIADYTVFAAGHDFRILTADQITFQGTGTVSFGDGTNTFHQFSNATGSVNFTPPTSVIMNTPLVRFQNNISETYRVTFDNMRLEGVATPVSSTDAATKGYVDTQAGKISPFLGRTKTLLVDFGQSNAESQGANSEASADEIDSDPLFQIWGNETPSFSALDISSGNNQSNDPTKHGHELGISIFRPDYLTESDTLFLVKHAVGGTYASTWFPNNTNGDSLRIYLKDAINYIQDAGYSASIIMLYSQGETESTNNDSTAIFEERLGALIKAWRDTLNSNVPFIVPGIYESNANDVAINDAIFHIADTSINVYYIPTQGYTSADALHWNYTGLKGIARDVCNVIDRKMGWQGAIIRNLAPNVFEEIIESANIVFNWKTEDFTKFTISGDSISNWADSLSAKALVSTNTNRPIFETADSSVVFSGGQFMFANQLFPRLYTDSAFTFFAVVDIDTTLDQTIFCQSNGSSERFAIGIKSGELCAGNFDGAWSSVATSSWSKDTKYVLAFRNSPTGTDKLFLNETQVSGGTQLPNTMISGFFRVGATTSGSYYNGKIYQILLLDEALSDAALASEISRLKSEHGIP